MSVPALYRASLPQGPASRVHHFTLITIILLASVVASTQPKDLCRQDRANFANQIHTIGSIDDALWAITKPDWNVYKLTPCNPANDSLVHCMEVDSPVEVDTKWPKLAEAAKSKAQASDLSFPVDNSGVMDSSQFGNNVLAMHANSFKNYSYFGFNFGENNSVYTQGTEGISNCSWISSDIKDKAYKLLDSGRKVARIMVAKQGDNSMMIQPNGSQTNICKIGSKDDLQVQFKVGGCSPDGANMVWPVSKGVLYRKQIYLFASDTVYIFSDQAETESTKLQTVSSTNFFHCFETTMAPPSSASNSTNPRVTTNTTHISTTAKSSSTIIIIIGVVVIVLVVILALITAYFCWCRTKAPKDGKSDSNAILGSSSPNDSKVSVKVHAVSKGPLKQSQTRAKAVASNTSFGKQKGNSSN